MKEKGIKQAPPKREIVRTSMIQAKDTTFFNENAVDRWSVSLKLDYLLQAEQFSGETYRFDEQVCDQLQALGMFNAKQPFHYMRWPTTAVRTNSGLIARQLFDERIKHLGTNDRRVVVTGKAGSGKSIALLQICAAALSEGYVVVAVPRGMATTLPFLIIGMDLVENRTAFHLEEGAKRYHQDQYLSNMITRTRKACRKTLAKVLSFSLYCDLTVGNNSHPCSYPESNICRRHAVNRTSGRSGKLSGQINGYLHRLSPSDVPTRPV